MARQACAHDMNAEPKNLDLLQNLETAVIQVWRANLEMTDHVAARAYEAVFERYRAESRDHQPKVATLAGLDRTVYEAVTAACELRLGRGALSAAGASIPPVSLEDLVDGLRQLRKSVERNTRGGGRQGYLHFVDEFLP